MLLLGCDFNGHVGEHSAGFEGVHRGSGYGMRNQDGLRILNFCVADKLAITNTFFRKNKRAQLKNIKDTKVISSEECITQPVKPICQNLSNPSVFHQEGRLGS